MKSSRTGLNKGNAVPPSYHAFFSFPVRKSGYSGVGTYVRKTAAVPIKAEEGLCGIIQPKPPLSGEECVSRPEAYPQRVIADERVGVEEAEEEEDVPPELDYKELDSEGRTLVLDFGLFVLINVYCPNDGGTEERGKYKADFHRVLEARVKGLIGEGREVMVVGDLNACAAVIDHCEGQLMVAKGIADGLEGEEGFWGKNAQRWLKGWMVAEDGTGGPMVDIVRRFWPERKGWNTKISARESNYGTRIDYVLITRGLLPWVKAADIQPKIIGSDHCPVYVDLHDEIVDSAGAVIKLQDAMGFKSDPPREPPRIASKFWDEYSGKQRLLQQFFGKQPASSSVSTTPSEPKPIQRSDTVSSGAGTPTTSQTTLNRDNSSMTSSSTPMPTPPLRQPSQRVDSTIASSSTSIKRKLTADTLGRHSSVKKQKQKKVEDNPPGQAKLSSFFAKPKGSSESHNPTFSKQTPGSQSSVPEDPAAAQEVVDVDEDADYRLAMLLSSQESDAPPPPRCGADSTQSKQAWSNLLAPVQPPKCPVHAEPAKELTVMKPGPNKGKKFFICSR
ncbi:hypothetical protein H0H81_009096 [Sphagnurus paluster]|uniref:DNA-(apurinic or apyrimidinic site) endonuclease 2 n=1 Tax=Sphagnurus paluster TaxID=117069 RepID=A0A9P7GJQ8_9AGAR|nr:hypothetical protein H0H81_009096 [Sphagnurus paluster]